MFVRRKVLPSRNEYNKNTNNIIHHLISCENNLVINLNRFNKFFDINILLIYYIKLKFRRILT